MTDQPQELQPHQSDGDIDILVRFQGAPSLSADDLYDSLTRELPDRTIRLAKSPQEEHELAAKSTVIVGNSLSRDLLDSASNLRLYVHVSSGIESLPLKELGDRGIAVTNAAGLMPCIAEQVLGFLLTHARELHEARRRQQQYEWRHFQPDELFDSTITVIGMGAIGTQILERLDPFGVTRIGIRHSPEKTGPADQILGYSELHTVLGSTDYLVLCCPLTESTRGLIGSKELEILPNDAIVVNVSRGAVVRTEPLLSALQRNTLGGAALDVTEPEPLPPEHPLWDIENVLLTPHNAGSSPNHWRRVAALLSENLDRVDQTGEYQGLRNQVVEP